MHITWVLEVLSRFFFYPVNRKPYQVFEQKDIMWVFLNHSRCYVQSRLVGGRSESRETNWEAITTIQAKDDDGFEWDGSCGGGEKWSYSGCILK